jgi:hypothetical protein
VILKVNLAYRANQPQASARLVLSKDHVDSLQVFIKTCGYLIFN